MKKQKLCALLCAVFLMSCVHLDVWAESFNDEIAGIQYESIEELQSCIKTHSLMKSSHQSQSALLSSMSQLFLPEVLCDHLNEIEQILVTPTYVSVNFEEDGQKLEFRHYPSGEQEYQLVVLDVMMPGMDGFETLEEIRKENSLPILMFTSKNDSISKVRGLRAGADDYLTKPFDMDELIARIVSLIRRYTRFNQQAGAVQKLDFDGLQIDLENRSVTTANGTFELPPKEFDLLLYCAKHQGKILTKQQIYEEVWGEEYFYDDSNIMAIISRLRKKLEVNPSSPKYIQTVKGIGYRFNKEV